MRKERFVRKLREQLHFIASSCRSYDQGVEIEAFRIAVALRVLFHKTKSSTPLVSHLKMESWEMLSSDTSFGDFLANFQIKIDLASPMPVRAIPKIGTRFVPQPVHKWWKEQVIYAFEGRNYSRSDLVLAAANQDGGAHVDDKLKSFYEDLAAGTRCLSLNGQNLVYPGGAPYDQSQTQYCRNTHTAMIRQFGHEVLASAKHYNWSPRLAVS